MDIGSQSYYSEKVIPAVDSAVQIVINRFLLECRTTISNPQQVRVIIDAGWSHPGWWARECTVLGIDADTGLPLAIYHVIRDKNFIGSSKGIYI